MLLFFPSPLWLRAAWRNGLCKAFGVSQSRVQVEPHPLSATSVSPSANWALSVCRTRNVRRCSSRQPAGQFWVFLSIFVMGYNEFADEVTVSLLQERSSPKSDRQKGIRVGGGVGGRPGEMFCPAAWTLELQTRGKQLEFQALGVRLFLCCTDTRGNTVLLLL